jgi:cytochrome c oxidase subunit 2
MRTILMATAAGVFAAVATAGVVLSQTAPSQTAPSGGGDERVVRITAKRFTYEPTTVTLVRGQPVILELVSLDRTHGFRQPQLNIRTEIPEGSSTRVRIVPDTAGRFFFACDVFCGSGHEEMEGDIVVTEQ